MEFADITLSKLFIGPDTIFSGEIDILNANIFDAVSENDVEIEQSEAADAVVEHVANGLSGANLTGTIKKGIATTYLTLRNICAILMLAALIFIGIRVLITSNIPSKRSMWLDLVQDWLIAMALLVFAHIIMIFIFYVSDTITNALSITMGGFGGLNFNLVVQCFLSFDMAEQVICLVMLGYLIYLTVIFLIAYFKRLLWVCVLIVIAPLVAVMYAFGSQTKQIYTKWLREFITTVLVQPFHLIVYTILVSVPLNMANSSLEFELSVTNFFTMVYSLIAISFIRPAERYIRELFGMGQGIAGVASFDSGKQTFDAIKKVIEDVAKKIMMVVAVVATGGAAAPEMIGAESATLVGEGTALVGEGTALAGEGTALVGEGTVLSEEAGAGLTTGTKNDLINANVASPNVDGGSQQGSPDIGIGDATGRGSEPSVEEDDYFLNEDEITSKNGSGNELSENNANEIVENNNINQDNSQENNTKGNNTQEDNNAKGNNTQENNIRENSTQENNTQENNTQENTDVQNSSEESLREAADELKEAAEMLKLASTGTVAEEIEEAADELKEAAEDAKEEKDAEEEKDKKKNDEDFTVTDSGSGEEGKRKRGFRDVVTDAANAPIEHIKRGQRMINGEESIADFIKGAYKGKIITGINDKLSNTKLGRKIEENGKVQKAKDAISSGVQIGDEFLKQGGFKDLHKGFNEIRDTFFVTPGGGINAPGDWKNTQNELEAKQKASQAQTKYNIVNNEGNQQMIIKQENIMEKLREQYKDREKYPEARLQEMAREQAKTKLGSLADTYLPLGIQNPQLMLELDKDRKQYGLSAESALMNRAQFEKFNNSPQVVQDLIASYKRKINADKVHKATDVTEGAKKYYYAGFKEPHQMHNLDMIVSKLNVSQEKAMQIYQVGMSKGRVEYTGTDKKIEKAFDELNNNLFKVK